MTAGSSILRSIAWPGKYKKRQRSGSGGSTGSGGSEDLEKSKHTKEGRRKLSGLALHCTNSIFSSTDPISSPNQSTQLKFCWPVEGLTQKVDHSANQGLDSKHFKVKINGVSTVWNLSIRFWINEQGDKISNPFLFCLNMIECKSNLTAPVEVDYKIGLYNRAVEQFDEGPEGVTTVVIDRSDQIQSVGVENVTLEDDNYNENGDILLQLRLSFNWNTRKTKTQPKVPSYLKSHPDQPDLVVVSGSRLFKVHKNVLAAASPVLADLIEGLKGEKDETDTLENKEVTDYGEVIEGLRKTHRRQISRKQILNKTAYKPQDKIVIPELPKNTLEKILAYIYTGSVDDLDLSCHHLVTACTLYQLSGLQWKCEEYLATLLTPSTVASLLILADNCRCDQLKRRAMQYCREHCDYIIKDSDWTAMEEDKPHLFEEAILQVAPVTCSSHQECVKNTRYNMERERGVAAQSRS
eukprot:GFUD01029681.1.p1 GENE.GFUD01029681.1~~GFUD01029681.1.p1  ORF type:complete len:466 (-),score=158.45 GFUD01029681.1:242-1639(-)